MSKYLCVMLKPLPFLSGHVRKNIYTMLGGTFLLNAERVITLHLVSCCLPMKNLYFGKYYEVHHPEPLPPLPGHVQTSCCRTGRNFHDECRTDLPSKLMLSH